MHKVEIPKSAEVLNVSCRLGRVLVDEEGFIDRIHVTPANAAESPQFETMIDGAKAKRILADKAYASKANREMFNGKYRYGIMRKAARNWPLRKSEKRFKKNIAKTQAQMTMAAIAAKLRSVGNYLEFKTAAHN